jgi:hypothetical protein
LIDGEFDTLETELACVCCSTAAIIDKSDLDGDSRSGIAGNKGHGSQRKKRCGSPGSPGSRKGQKSRTSVDLLHGFLV